MLLDSVNRNLPSSLCLGRIDAAELQTAFIRRGFVETEPNDIASHVFASDTQRIWLIEDLATGTVSVTSETGAPLPAWLPQPDVEEILRLISSDNAKKRLAGLQMAGGRDEKELAEAIAPLVNDTEPHVVRAALAWLVEHEGTTSAIDPIDAFFSLPDIRREKLQIMRWWMRDRPAETEKLIAALDGALKDADWEIAATAMLTAATLELVDLAPRFRKIALPDGPGGGVTRDEARLLIALRDAGLARLGHGSAERVPPAVFDVFQGKPDGLPLDLRHFAAALSKPLPVGSPPPEVPGLTMSQETITSSDGRPLAWIPPGSYRLGVSGLHRDARHNPPRIHEARAGFFIDVHPRAPATFDAAHREAQSLSEARNFTVALPDATMWEMSMRGADGRRFPWGLAKYSRSDESPHGLVGLFEPTGEWIDSDEENTALTAGGPERIVPALQYPTEKRESRAYRFVFVLH